MSNIDLALIRQKYRTDGGAERFVARMLDSLKQENLQLNIITRNWKNNAHDDYRVIRCDPFYVGRTLRDYTFAKGAQKIIRNQFDLIQSHERVIGCDIYRAGDGVHKEWLKQRSRSTNWLTKLSLYLSPYHNYTKYSEQKLYSHPKLKAVICNSNMVREEIIKYFNVDSNKLFTIYNGVDTSLFNPNLKINRHLVRSQLSIPHKATLFLFVGSGFFRKGLEGAISALSKANNHPHLLVVGYDKYLKKYKNLARRYQIHNRIHFTGAVEDTSRYYATADALLFPTLYDPFGNTVLEAMASGIPVITSHKCGMAEFIQNGHNGFVCDAFDINSLTTSINMLQDPIICEQLGKNAYNSVKSLDLTNMTKQLLELYDAALS